MGIGEALAAPRFPVDAATASRALTEARSRGAGFADLYLETRTVTRMNLADGAIESVEQGIFAGGGVRAVDGDRTGYAYADSFEEAPLLDAAKSAATIAASAAGGLRPDHLSRRDASADRAVRAFIRRGEAGRAARPGSSGSTRPRAPTIRP